MSVHHIKSVFVFRNMFPPEGGTPSLVFHLAVQENDFTPIPSLKCVRLRTESTKLTLLICGRCLDRKPHSIYSPAQSGH